MESNKQCIIIIPIYKSLSDIEQAIVKHAQEVTLQYKKVFIAPLSYQLDESFDNFKSIDVVRFDDFYFENIEGYNQLMLSIEFYQAFSEYEYMLIHQTDAYLFKPELEYWCNKGYAYIGAPWLKPKKMRKELLYKFLFTFFPFCYSDELIKKRLGYNHVGNGGLSLRKINIAITILKNAPQALLNRYLTDDDHKFNEDLFWGIEASRLNRKFKIPGWKQALKFSFETYPELAYEINDKQLPFGCHAFDRHGIEFWKQFIPPLNK